MTDQGDLFTLADAAQVTGLSAEAIRLRVRRGKLKAVKGNDGRVRVKLDPDTLAWLKSAVPGVGRPTGQPTEQSTGHERSADDTPLIAALREHIADLRAKADVAADLGRAVALLGEQLAEARQRADAAEMAGREADARATAAESMASAAEAQAAVFQARAEAAEQRAQEAEMRAVEAIERAEAASARATTAETAADAQRAELEALQVWARLPWWRRWRSG